MSSPRYLSDERVHRKRSVDNESLITVAPGDAVQVESPDVRTQGWGSTGAIPANRTEAFA